MSLVRILPDDALLLIGDWAANAALARVNGRTWTLLRWRCVRTTAHRESLRWLATAGDAVRTLFLRVPGCGDGYDASTVLNTVLAALTHLHDLSVRIGPGPVHPSVLPSLACALRRRRCASAVGGLRSLTLDASGAGITDVSALTAALAASGKYHPSLCTATVDVSGNPLTLDRAAALVATVLSHPGMRTVHLGLARLPPCASAHVLASAFRHHHRALSLTTLHVNLSDTALPRELAEALPCVVRSAGRLRHLAVSLAGLCHDHGGGADVVAQALTDLLTAAPAGLQRCYVSVAHTSAALVCGLAAGLRQFGAGGAAELNSLDLDVSAVPCDNGTVACLWRALGAVFARIQRPWNLRLQLHHTGINHAAVEGLCATIAEAPSSHLLYALQLGLRGNPLGDAAAVPFRSPLLPLRGALPRCVALGADLGACGGMRQPHIEGTLFVAATLPRLETLSLAAYSSPLCVRVDCGSLWYATALRRLRLDLRNVGGSIEGLAALGCLVQLEELELFAASAHLCAPDVLPLGEAVRRPPRLAVVRLLLANNYLDAAALEWLAHAIAAAPTLTSLDLDVSGNPLAGGPVRRLVEALRGGAVRLTTACIQLCGTGLADADCAAVGNLGGAVPSLQSLSLGLAYNPGAIGPATAETVSWLRFACPRLHTIELDLRACALDDTAMEALSTLSNTSHLGLRLEYNPNADACLVMRALTRTDSRVCELRVSVDASTDAASNLAVLARCDRRLRVTFVSGANKH